MKWKGSRQAAGAPADSAVPGRRDVSALILFAHGSRDPDWDTPFRALQHKIKAACPNLTVELAFLELMQPTLSDATSQLVASGYRTIVIAPIFMAQGAHLKLDLAELVRDIRERHADIEVQLLAPAGEAEPVLNAISTWLIQSVSHGLNDE